MKKTALLLLLCLSLLLSACQPASTQSMSDEVKNSPAQTQAQPSATPAKAASPAPQSSAPAASEEPASTIAPTEQISTQTPIIDCPVDLTKAAPLLEALAESLVLDGDQDAGFERYPSSILVDRIFARLLRDGWYDERYVSVLTHEEGAVQISEEGMEELYEDCFSEGEFEELPRTGAYGKEKDDAAEYIFPDGKELQFSMQLKSWEPLVEEDYYELELQLYWAYPEDAQATLGGSVRCWVKVDDDSAFGMGLALLETNMTLRPGDDFGAHPARDVELIMPMLHAVAKACLETGEGFNEIPSNHFAFEAAYVLLNSYGEDFGLDASDSSVTVSKGTMDKAMQALFGLEYATPSSMPSALRGRLQKSGSGYTLKRSQEETTPVYVDYAVNMNAIEMITISLRTGDKTENSPWEFHGSATIAVNALNEGLPYRNRYAESVSFTPNYNN